jgi:Glycosyltransferase
MFRVLEKHKNVTFKILHGIPDFFKNHKKIKLYKAFKPVTKYPQWVVRQGFDIGVAPLVDNNFNRGKSNLRWLEYSAMKVPTVASPLPHFTQSIRHGETGFIANTPEQWEHYLTLLINDAEKRKQIGQNAYDEVKNNWSLKSLGEKYETAIKELSNAEPNTVGHSEFN